MGAGLGGGGGGLRLGGCLKFGRETECVRFCSGARATRGNRRTMKRRGRHLPDIVVMCGDPVWCVGRIVGWGQWLCLSSLILALE